MSGCPFQHLHTPKPPPRSRTAEALDILKSDDFVCTYGRQTLGPNKLITIEARELTAPGDLAQRNTLADLPLGRNRLTTIDQIIPALQALASGQKDTLLVIPPDATSNHEQAYNLTWRFLSIVRAACGCAPERLSGKVNREEQLQRANDWAKNLAAPEEFYRRVIQKEGALSELYKIEGTSFFVIAISPHFTPEVPAMGPHPRFSKRLTWAVNRLRDIDYALENEHSKALSIGEATQGRTTFFYNAFFPYIIPGDERFAHGLVRQLGSLEQLMSRKFSVEGVFPRGLHSTAQRMSIGISKLRLQMNFDKADQKERAFLAIGLTGALLKSMRLEGYLRSDIKTVGGGAPWATFTEIVLKMLHR